MTKNCVWHLKPDSSPTAASIRLARVILPRPLVSSLRQMARSASCTPSAFKPYVDQMKARGKPFKVVMIALARKFLTIANAITRDKTSFSKAA